jgi:hypothetical protein
MQGSTKLKTNPEVVARELAGPEGAVLLHLDTGAYHGLNTIGFLIWGYIDGKRTVDEIVAAVRERVTDAPPALQQEVRAFLESGLERNLITVVE